MPADKGVSNTNAKIHNYLFRGGKCSICRVPFLCVRQTPLVNFVLSVGPASGYLPPQDTYYQVIGVGCKTMCPF